MKILLITPTFHPILGGSETMSRTICEKLSEKGIEIDLMTFNMNEIWKPLRKYEVINNKQYKIYKIPGINPFYKVKNPLHMLFRSSIIPYSKYLKLVEEYDILHYIGESDLTFPLYTYKKDIPKIMQCIAVEGLNNYFSKWKNLRSITRKIFANFADYYISSSTEESQILNKIGVPKDKIIIQYEGVDTDFFTPGSHKIDNLILFVGRVYKIKGLHILLQSLYNVKKSVKLVIIGPISDQAYFRKIEKTVNDLNENTVHSVEYLGPMKKSELISWYQKATLLVCPYMVETISLVVLEAISCGTTTIRTIDHVPMNGIGSINTYNVPRNDPLSLGKSIEYLLNNTEYREELGQESRKIVLEKYSWKNIIPRYIELYEKVIQENQRK